jgi:phage terminase small subunit
MARPAKAIATKTGVITKEEERLRRETEDRLKGGADKLVPPIYLTKNQREVFYFVLEEHEKAQVLGNLDLFALAQLAVCVDRLQDIEQKVNENPELLCETKLMQTRDRYARDFLRLVNEFCMSPQSRAKLSISAVQQAAQREKKTLMDLINEDDEGEG